MPITFAMAKADYNDIQFETKLTIEKLTPQTETKIS